MASVASSVPGGRALSASARRALILGPPLVVAVYEVFHPNPDVNAEAVMDVAGWFALFHAIQLVLFPLLVLSIALLAQNLGVYEHWLTRLGLVLVLVFFSAYDAIAGIATGLAMRDARDLPVAEQEAVFEVVKDWPGFEPAVFAIGAVAVVGMVLALAMLTIGARRLQVGRGPIILLAVATIVALGGHPFPFGTVAFGCLFLAALWLERSGYGTQVSRG